MPGCACDRRPADEVRDWRLGRTQASRLRPVEACTVCRHPLHDFGRLPSRSYASVSPTGVIKGRRPASLVLASAGRSAPRCRGAAQREASLSTRTGGARWGLDETPTCMTPAVTGTRCTLGRNLTSRPTPSRAVRPHEGHPGRRHLGYAYLLGMYPGDGDICRTRTWRLRITMDMKWPGVTLESLGAMRDVLP